MKIDFQTHANVYKTTLLALLTDPKCAHERCPSEHILSERSKSQGSIFCDRSDIWTEVY